ncbi:MAG: glucosaminidase domain-containing protein [Rikenellaceae bacterium]
MKRFAFLQIFLLSTIISLAQESRQTREEYIDRYAAIAVAHMERYGIPASITMAQGILESDSGNSILSKKSNNHFGIKCKGDWTGRTVRYDDDARQECFRAYRSVEHSYQDHAEFLDNSPRYDSLFNYSSNDYRSWARGLKAAGYATAPDYAPRLIKIIEENKLYLLDGDKGLRRYTMRNNDQPVWFEEELPAERIADKGVDPNDFRVSLYSHHGYNVYRMNGVEYIIAKQDESIERISKLFQISRGNLRRFNELEKTESPIEGEIIFLAEKRRRWQGNAREHIVRNGETVHSVAQSYGLREQSLRRLNSLKRSTHELEERSRIKIQ